MENVELGDRAKDLVSGLTGLVTSVTTYLNGCVRYGITPEGQKDGKPFDAIWFDENEIALVQKNVASWGVKRQPITTHGARGGDPSGR